MAPLHFQTGSSRHVCPPKKTYKYIYFLHIFWAGLHPIFFLNIKLALKDIDGASPSHSPKSGWECLHRWRKSLIPPEIPQPTCQNMPHRWRISFHPGEEKCPKNRAQVRQGLDEDKKLFWNAFANANPLSLLKFHVWDANRWRKPGKGLMMRTRQRYCF